MAGLNFDDINIGDEIAPQSFTPDQDSIWSYGAASGDLNPIHMDREYGERAGLGGSIVHGISILARAGKCITDWAGSPGGLKRLKGRFKAPVRPGDEITFTGEVVDKRIEDESKLVVVGMKAEIQDGTIVLGKCEAVVEL